MKHNTISMVEKAFWNTDVKEISKMQSKMDKVAESLNEEQLKLLNEVMDWVSNEKVCEHSYDQSQFD